VRGCAKLEQKLINECLMDSVSLYLLASRNHTTFAEYPPQNGEQNELDRLRMMGYDGPEVIYVNVE
jgi:hypothetical protein